MHKCPICTPGELSVKVLNLLSFLCVTEKKEMWCRRGARGTCTNASDFPSLTTMWLSPEVNGAWIVTQRNFCKLQSATRENAELKAFMWHSDIVQHCTQQLGLSLEIGLWPFFAAQLSKMYVRVRWPAAFHWGAPWQNGRSSERPICGRFSTPSFRWFAVDAVKGEESLVQANECTFRARNHTAAP